MEITPTTLILVGVICVFLGFVVSSLLNTLRDEEVLSPEEGIQAPPGGRKGKYLPIVRLWREIKNGTIVVEYEGKSFVNSDPLDEIQRTKLEGIAREFRGWLGIGINQPQGNNEADNDTPILQNIDEKNKPEVVSTQGDITRVQEKIVVPGQKVKVTSTQEVVLVPGGKSIVMQIDDILQDMLATNPLGAKKIHLSEDPQRGVLVTVGDDIYMGIDMVPDNDTRTLIKAAVTAWERSQ